MSKLDTTNGPKRMGSPRPNRVKTKMYVYMMEDLHNRICERAAEMGMYPRDLVIMYCVLGQNTPLKRFRLGQNTRLKRFRLDTGEGAVS